MPAWIALPLLAAHVAAPAPSRGTHSPVTVSARASAVILSGAKISLSGGVQPEGYKLNAAVITDQDGNRRPAKLVEFQ